jgi:signal transduction histidine kinase/DNA-binding response OmpR family regulator/ligand-binding sensor domain-containing protein
MVFVTEGLVNIYDGASFHYLHYNEQKAYRLKKYSGYHRVYVDNENHLWIKNQYNLMLFDINTQLFIPHIDSVLLAQGVKCQAANFFMDTDYNFWFVGETNELIYRNTQTKSTQIFLSNILKISSFPDDQLYDLVKIEKQLFLFFKSGEMVCYHIDTAQELYRENPYQGNTNNYTGTLMVVPHKQYLYQSRNGINCGQLVRFNTLNRKWERVLETDYWLNTLTLDQEDNCWISSFSGLWKIDEDLYHQQLISPLHMVDGRSFDCEISTQFNDNQGGLWVGTVNRGLLYFHPDRFKFRNIGHSLFNKAENSNLNVTCFAEFGQNILVGSVSGLYEYESQSQKLTLSKQIPATTDCSMMLKDSKNRLWIGTQSNGLYRLDGKSTVHYNTPEHTIYMHEAFDGQLFLCTDIGPGIFDPQTGNFIKATTEKQLDYACQLTDYRQDTLLGYSNEGLFFYDIRTNAISFPEKDSPILQHSNHHYHCLYTDSRGLIWLGTHDGLNVFNTTNQSTISFHEADRLVNNSIRSVMEDYNGRIWVSTSNGISCIVLTPRDGSYNFRFTNYNRFDGIIENEFLPRSAAKTINGHLLWGGLDGFNEIDLNQLDKPQPQLSAPLFTRFTLAGIEIKMGETYHGNLILKQSVTNTKELILNHYQNFLGIEFSALNYVNPSQTCYRYQLEGVDAAWREIGTHDGIGNVGYTNLSPGTYHFKVQATTNNQVWDKHMAELTIVIKPPFWKTIWAYSAYLILVIGLGYVLLSYSIRRNIKHSKKRQKEELDQLKFSFFTNISHELRTPLTLIITPLDSLIKKMNNDTVKSQLSGILYNANELLRMVNQLLDFRKLEMNGETLNLGYCNLNELMVSIVPPFKELAQENEVHFEFYPLETELFLYVDQDKIRKIMNNLLSNAFKFTPKKGHIQVRILKDEGNRQIQVEVADSGCGIAKDEQAQIFDRFYQAKNQKNLTGSGIGLHLVKEYAGLHNGSVAVESRINVGSVFTVTLSTDLKPQNRTNLPNGDNEANKSLKILVIDDHLEFRNFLFNELSEKYKVIMASDGKEGLQKAQIELPDLIVSDVMMPVMSGTELCQQLKANLAVSHIPVILLTAKTSDEAQIEGFEAGADAYISKPFNMEILLLRIENLLEQQAKRKELFRKSIVITPASLATSTVDEELIKKVLGLIEANMNNGNYSVEQLSKDMYMDRTGLYRKLMAITGQAPTEFIRAVRLKKAAQMLQHGQSVSEVAEQVGFGSNSYFTKCFQEEFGVKPSKYKDTTINAR